MIISEYIFELMEMKKMSRKTFSERTGIALSTIADWKRKKTNPGADKIMIICETLDVSPEELLSCGAKTGTKSRVPDYLVIAKDSKLGFFIESYNRLESDQRRLLEGYMEALNQIRQIKKEQP